MRLSLSRVAGFAFVLLLTAQAEVGVAQESATAHPSYSFDLDVPAGHYSFWALDDLGASTTLEGTFQIVELRRHNRWAPGFAFRLEAANGALFLQFTAPKGAAGPLAATVGELREGAQPKQMDLPARVALGDSVRVRLDWSTPGELVAMIGDGTWRFQHSLTPTRLRIVTSTGQMKGQGVKLCRVTSAGDC